jgi:hypothetical protein
MENAFKTSNLSLAAAILASGQAKFVRINQITFYKSEYVFSPKDKCEEIQKKYINNELSLPVRVVEENIKVLKSLGQKGGQNGY